MEKIRCTNKDSSTCEKYLKGFNKPQIKHESIVKMSWQKANAMLDYIKISTGLRSKDVMVPLYSVLVRLHPSLR